MNFAELITEAGEQVKGVQGRFLERHGSVTASGSWWFSFTRAGCLYRISFIRQAFTLTLEKGQGSFVPGSQTKWLFVEVRHLADETLASVLDGTAELLERFSARSAGMLPGVRTKDVG
jgi:hypothetical protein